MKKIISLTALWALSLPLLAADKDVFYGSLGGGVYQLETQDFDETAPIMKITGGYNFTENVALEASFTNLFEASEVVDGINVDIDGRAWDLSTRLSYPLSNRFSPYARLGWSYVDLNARATDDGEVVRFNNYDDGFAWAVGVGVDVGKRFSIDGEYSRTEIDEGDLDYASLNLNYRFGAQ